MNFFRRPVRLAVSLKKDGGRAVFRLPATGDPELESWDPKPMPLSRKTMVGFETTSCGTEDQPFLHFDVRTPYGEVAEETQVLAAGREALGEKAGSLPISGWHVSNLADTNLGSNHRIFATLGNARAGRVTEESWDQMLPLELALLALGDFAARTSGFADFQVTLDRGPSIYSLIYREAQPWHLFRIAAQPGGHARKRLQEHRRLIPDASAAVPIFMAGSENFRQWCVETFGVHIQPLPLPAGISREDVEPNAWHFGLALAARQEEFAAHNLVSPRQWDSNRKARLIHSTVRGCVAALVAAALLFAIEGARALRYDRSLKNARAEAAEHEETLATLNSLRMERGDLQTALTRLKPLWNGPVSLQGLLGEIARALPASGSLDGFFLHRSEGGGLEVSFRALVSDWNQIRPFQESLQRSPLFTAVEFSDQFAADGHRGVRFQGVCRLAERP